MLAIVLLAVVCCFSTAQAQFCESAPFAGRDGCKCTATNGTRVTIPPDDRYLCNSDEFKDCCCWRKNSCRNKLYTPPTGDKPDKDKDLPELPDLSKLKKRKERYFDINPPNPCDPGPFPTECKPDSYSRYVLDPPMNIPYCVRIPCSADPYDQAEYDESHRLCGSQPGCYFDVELSEIRYEYGPDYLPGVPVCHMAIRVDVFHRAAEKVADYLEEGYNPYFTECILDTYDEEIRKGPEGCKLIPLLKVFHILPKMAGWDGITSYPCALIGACWRSGEGCFYPVSVNDLVVKSGQRMKYNRFEIVYGRPKCQNFDPRTPYSILKSYHDCLNAGCSVDANIAYAYYNHLYEIGLTMSAKNHWDYWEMVEGGKLGSYNLENILWPYLDKPSRKAPPKPQVPPPPPPSGGGIFDLPGLGGGGGGGGGGGRDTRGGGMSTFKLPGMSSGKSKGCGPAFQHLGYRPCPPPELPDIHANTECPYVPYNFHRFKPLKGSFRGCCKINACYLARADIRRMHSGPSYYYTPWSFFTKCSKKCGGGIKRRHRNCISHDPSRCTEKTEQIEKCNTHPCGYLGPWGRWSPCHSACGIKTRKRECIGGDCEGVLEQSERCSSWC